MPTISDAVSSGMAAYASAESSLQAAHDALLQLPAAYMAAYQANPIPPEQDVKPFGYLEAMQRSASARQAAGRVANLLASIIFEHKSDTDRCQELGIDLPLPTAPGTVHPDGGGR